MDIKVDLGFTVTAKFDNVTKKWKCHIRGDEPNLIFSSVSLKRAIAETITDWFEAPPQYEAIQKHMTGLFTRGGGKQHKLRIKGVGKDSLMVGY